jgi:outer membrane protein assembly complex protein YaeT
MMETVEYDAAKNRVRPTIRANGGPKVKIEAEGAKLSKRKLKRYVPVFDEGTVNRDLLVLGARNLRDYFQTIGYFDVEVDFRIEEPAADQQRITYVVNLGERHKLVQVAIQGNRYFDTDDLRERMFLQPAGFIRLRHGRYSEGFLARDESSIASLYQANGFRDVKVTSESVDDYRGNDGNVAVTVRIEEGPQYVVSSLDVNGIKSLDEKAMVSMLASIPGEPFSENNVAMDRNYIIRRYQSAGFPDAAFDWKQVPGPGSNQVRVQYFITEGERRFVRDVLITGMRSTRGRLVNPNITVKSGEPLSWTAMAQTQQNLYNLGVFDKVNMAIQNPDGDTDRKYVLYHVEEGHKYQVAVGAGAEIARIGGSQSSLNAPAGATGFAPRASLDVSRLNLWGLGHSLNFKSRYSTLNRRVSLNYLAPRYRDVEGRNISVTALYDNIRDVLTFTGRRLEGDVQLSSYLTKAVTAMWRYSYRDVRVNASNLKIEPLLVPLYSQPARIGEISQSLIQDRRDNPADAHRGIYNTLDTALAYRAFGSQRNFSRILARSAWYRRLPAQWVLASSTQFGWIHPFSVPAGTDPSQFVPLPERLWGGGSTSHRGFPDNQAGPRDPLTGFPVGGNALLFHSTEFRFPFIGDNIGGVLFHDFGNIFSSLKDISFRVHQKNLTDFNYMVHAVGFGIRYRTPVGPIRVDLAYSMNPPTFNGLKGTYQELLHGTAPRVVQNVSHFQFFFSIGQAFCCARNG